MHACGDPGCGDLDVVVPDLGAVGDIAQEPRTSRKAHRQREAPCAAVARGCRRPARRPRRRASRRRADHAWPGRRPPRRLARDSGRLARERGARDADAELEPDEVGGAQSAARCRRARSRARRPRMRPRRSDRPRRWSRTRPSADRPARPSRPGGDSTRPRPCRCARAARRRRRAADARPARRCRRTGNASPLRLRDETGGVRDGRHLDGRLVPSRNEQNIWALSPAVCSGGRP